MDSSNRLMDPIINKVLPHSIEAEEAVLGSLIIDSDSYYKVTLAPADFYREKNAVVYAARQGIDMCDQVTLAHELSKRKQLDMIGGAAYISYLVNQCASAIHIEHYAGIVKQCAAARKLIKMAATIEELGFNQDPNGTDKAMRLLLSLRTNTNVALSPRDQADYFLEYYSSLSNGTLQPLSFGLSSLDKLGMQPGEYGVLGGSTEMGKTTALHQIAEHQKGPVLYCTTEMTEAQWVRRSGAQVMKVPMSKLGDMKYIKEHEADWVTASALIAEGNIYVITGSITPSQIYAEAMKIDNLQLIIVDYLQRLRGVEASYNSVSMASRALADIAKDTNIPLIVASQLSRDFEKDGKKKPYLDRLKDSGNIENDADLVMFVERNKDARPGTPERLLASIFVAKHKQGGEHFEVKLRFDPKTQRYEEIA